MHYLIPVFLGAYLLFTIQPMIARYILPWFGGTPAVWTTCMLFFQVGLLAGYAYAHGIATRLSPRKQSILHILLLGAALLLLPVIPDPAYRPADAAMPAWRILALLLHVIGLPYLLLASTSPLLQRWYARSLPERSPYRLYALSNAGSLLGLLGYPFLLEPWLTLDMQIYAWSALFVAFALTCTVAGWHASRSGDCTPVQEIPADAPTPTRGRSFLWFALSACGVMLLVAITNQMCQEVAVVPFLWVVPLALYLLSFIFCFESERWYKPHAYSLAYRACAILACYLLFAGIDAPLWLQIPGYSATLFTGCMILHGELARLKPPSIYLTRYFLIIAAGGACGGAFVAMGAPYLFSGYWEFHMALVGCLVLALAAQHSRNPIASTAQRNAAMRILLFTGILVLVLVKHSLATLEDTIARSRNFYGILRVTEHMDEELGPYRKMAHGRIQHGMQLMDLAVRDWPTTYYQPASGIGMAIRLHPRRMKEQPLRIGVIGLGAGTVAAYGRQGDRIEFFEINPDVLRLAQSHFTFLADSKAATRVILGDGRIMLEQLMQQEGGHRYDVLAIDAFSSDAIPMHLLTAECFALYLQALAPDGILAINVTNRFVDLRLLARRLARNAGYTARYITCENDLSRAVYHAQWILVTQNKAFLEQEEIRNAPGEWPTGDEPPVWTDNYGSLVPVLKW